MNRDLLRIPAIRSGIQYGLIGGAVELVLLLLEAANGTASAPGVLHNASGFISVVAVALSLYGILIYAFAGRLAAKQTGTIRSGALAGLVAAIVAGVISLILTPLQVLLAPATLDFMSQMESGGGALTGGAFVAVQLLLTLIDLGFGAGLGALGGLVGRRSYRQIA